MNVLQIYSVLEKISGRITPSLSDGQMLYLCGTGLVERVSVPQLNELHRKALDREALRDGFERSLMDTCIAKEAIGNLEKKLCSSWHRLWSRTSTLDAEVLQLAEMKSTYPALREKTAGLLNRAYDRFTVKRKVSHSVPYDGQHIVLTDNAFLLLSIANVHIIQREQISSYEALQQLGERMIDRTDYNTEIMSCLRISSRRMQGMRLVNDDAVRSVRKQQLSEVIEGLKVLQYAVLYKPAYSWRSKHVLN